METQEKMNKSEMGKKECVKRIQEYAKDAYQWLMAGNREQVVLKIAAIELAFLVIVFLLISFFGNWEYEFFKIHGVSTLIALLVSAPIAFAIWHFRDANTQQQIANQRKDVNLKEFQKIAEWVSGAHLVEEKITEKNKATKKGSEQESSEQETAREYSRQPEKQNITTFSKQDGAVGLQIAAIYMLLPFYRGDHGEDFRRPAFNLLTAAWLSLFSKVENIETGHKLAKQPLAVAITEVLFADGGLVYSTEEKYKHLLVNLYLPFVNLNLPGLSEKALSVFAGRNCQGIDLHGATLRKTHFEKSDLKKAYLYMTDLREANFENADLKVSYLQGAHFEKADLNNADLKGADLMRTHFERANLTGADLKDTGLVWTYLEIADLFGAQLTESDFNQIPTIGVSEVQKADLIVLALLEPPISTQAYYQLTATRKTKTFTHSIGEKVEHTISGYRLDVQKTKELNQANWEIEIKELPPNTP